MNAVNNLPQQLKKGIPLALENVRKRFGEREVLKGIELRIPAGQFVAIVGRSGCGKSTLLRLLCWPAWMTPAKASCWQAPRRWTAPAKRLA